MYGLVNSDDDDDTILPIPESLWRRVLFTSEAALLLFSTSLSRPILVIFLLVGLLKLSMEGEDEMKEGKGRALTATATPTTSAATKKPTEREGGVHSKLLAKSALSNVILDRGVKGVPLM